MIYPQMTQMNADYFSIYDTNIPVYLPCSFFITNNFFHLR